jgi:hypothetical protein
VTFCSLIYIETNHFAWIWIKLINYLIQQLRMLFNLDCLIIYKKLIEHPYFIKSTIFYQLIECILKIFIIFLNKVQLREPFKVIIDLFYRKHLSTIINVIKQYNSVNYHLLINFWHILKIFYLRELYNHCNPSFSWKV